MAKASTDKFPAYVLKAPAFLGEPLFIQLRKQKSYTNHRDQMRLIGEALARFANDGTGIFDTPNGSASNTEEERQMLLRWLSRMPKLPPKMLTEIANYAGMIKPEQTAIHSRVISGRVLLLSTTVCQPPSAKSALGYLVASLSYFAYLDRFACCPECGTWFFDIPWRRRMKRFCSPRHSNRYRQRKYRQKQK